MPLTQIQTIDHLKAFLDVAMQLEHATIPPYLMALYSIHPGTNSDASHVIRVVAVEEMLHLTLAANLLNAIGGKPDLTREGFIPKYPASLPDGEHDFTVSIGPFSPAAIETFLKIERPKKQAPSEDKRLLPRERKGPACLAINPVNPELSFWSIGEFYREIERGFDLLNDAALREGKSIFVGDPKLQITPEYYYSGGGEIIAVTDMASARKAIHLIVEQGEGDGGEIFDHETELAHYYRFQQLDKRRYYQLRNAQGKRDEKDHPTGPELKVDYDAVYQFKVDAKLDEYKADPQLYEAVVDFNIAYRDFLALINRAYNGHPELLIDAVPDMFRLRNKILQIIHNPIPGQSGVNAAPTFDVDHVPQGVPA